MSTIPEKYRDTTKTALMAAAGCGPLGAFSTIADIATISGIWGAYLYNVARGECIVLDKESAVQICKSALLGMAGYYAGCKTATKFCNFIPGMGTLIGMGVSALTNVLFTYHFALTVCKIFTEQGKSLNLARLADEIRCMYRGNGIARDVKDIAAICMHA